MAHPCRTHWSRFCALPPWLYRRSNRTGSFTGLGEHEENSTHSAHAKCSAKVVLQCGLLFSLSRGKIFLWQINCHVVFLHTWPNLDETAWVLYSLTAPRIPILMVWILQLQKLWSLKIRRQQLGTWQKQDRLLRLSSCNAFSSTNGGHTTSLISIWYFHLLWARKEKQTPANGMFWSHV